MENLCKILSNKKGALLVCMPDGTTIPSQIDITVSQSLEAYQDGCILARMEIYYDENVSSFERWKVEKDTKFFLDGREVPGIVSVTYFKNKDDDNIGHLVFELRCQPIETKEIA